MKLQLRNFLASGIAFVAMGFCSAVSNADYLEDFTTNQTALFDFGAYSGNYAFNAEGLDVNIPASGDSFGGVGIAPVTTVIMNTVTQLQVTARVDAGNGSPLILSVREDNGSGGDGEFFAYSIPASAFAGGGFVTVNIDPTSFFFNGDSTDGVLNGVLNNTSIQSPFGGTAAQFYTIQSVGYVGAIPEPGSFVALLVGSALLVSRRQRK